MQVIEKQKEVCFKFGTEFISSPDTFKIGISLSVKNGVYPIHGLRHPVKEDTSGWFIWAGEYSDDPNFFIPLHIEHLNEWNPLILKYLGLPPGWRFLITPEYEDVWKDDLLLDI